MKRHPGETAPGANHGRPRAAAQEHFGTRRGRGGKPGRKTGRPGPRRRPPRAQPHPAGDQPGTPAQGGRTERRGGSKHKQMHKPDALVESGVGADKYLHVDQQYGTQKGRVGLPRNAAHRQALFTVCKCFFKFVERHTQWCIYQDLLFGRQRGVFSMICCTACRHMYVTNSL